MWPDVTNVTRCDKFDQMRQMWPGVTNVSNIENMTNLTKFILMLPGGHIGHRCPDSWHVIFWPILKEAHKPTHSYCLSFELCQKNTNHKVTMGPWACGPLGLIAMSPNPISAAGAIRSQPCLVYFAFRNCLSLAYRQIYSPDVWRRPQHRCASQCAWAPCSRRRHQASSRCNFGLGKASRIACPTIPPRTSIARSGPVSSSTLMRWPLSPSESELRTCLALGPHCRCRLGERVWACSGPRRRCQRPTPTVTTGPGRTCTPSSWSLPRGCPRPRDSSRREWHCWWRRSWCCLRDWRWCSCRRDHNLMLTVKGIFRVIQNTIQVFAIV